MIAHDPLSPWHEDFEPRPARVATGSLVGSPERIAAYAARVARGESLWHPQDCRQHYEPGERRGARPLGLCATPVAIVLDAEQS